MSDEPCLRYDTRPNRNSSKTLLDRRDVKELLEKIGNNHRDTVIFKIKNHIQSDITSDILECVFEKFYGNTVCEALYIQNLPDALGDDQILKLLDLLKYCSLYPPGTDYTGPGPHCNVTSSGRLDNMKCHRCNRAKGASFRSTGCQCRPIWCLNVGELDHVSNSMWKIFTHELQFTDVTHMYVSEHLISIDLKNKMRDVIRANRAKHPFHNDERNIEVIQRCTNCWWNPINSIKHAHQLIEFKKQEKIRLAEEAKEQKRLDKIAELERIRAEKEAIRIEEERKAKKRSVWDINNLTPDHVEYWYLLAKGNSIPQKCKKTKAQLAQVKADSAAWKFLCVCGEKCSSYENYRYHPTGLQFQCGNCDVWCHAKCIFNDDKVTEADLDGKYSNALYCGKCRAANHRNRVDMSVGTTSANASGNKVPQVDEQKPEPELFVEKIEMDTPDRVDMSVGTTSANASGNKVPQVDEQKPEPELFVEKIEMDTFRSSDIPSEMTGDQ